MHKGKIMDQDRLDSARTIQGEVAEGIGCSVEEVGVLIGVNLIIISVGDDSRKMLSHEQRMMIMRTYSEFGLVRIP